MGHRSGTLQRRASLPNLLQPRRPSSLLTSPVHLPASPFPAHVQVYLGSCRTRCLADIRGAKITKLGDKSEAFKKELELLSEKIDRRKGKKPEEKKSEEVTEQSKASYTPLISITNTVLLESVLSPQHLTGTPAPGSPPDSPKSHCSSFSLSPPPKPSIRLQTFLNSHGSPTSSTRRLLDDRGKKYPPGWIIGRFSLPRGVERRANVCRTECSSPSGRKGMVWPMTPCPGKTNNGFSVMAGVEDRKRRNRGSCG